MIDSWLPGFLLKNNQSGFKKEAMNPGRGVVKSECLMTNAENSLLLMLMPENREL
jgi:hypothetical protein